MKTNNDIYANIFASMTTKLSNMKSNGLINDYFVDCTIKDWSCNNDKKDYSQVTIEVNDFDWSEEFPQTTLKFNAEHPFSQEEYDQFNDQLNQIIRTARKTAEDELKELVEKKEAAEKKVVSLSESEKVKPVDKEYYGF